ncbi:insulinase family protein [Alkaliphilus sp. MSJ-5]|uniref:Insulinase family protein n=1 Tax=Alkaliphilus flagellatus TaxID=2841507 RepID=A0ABS6G4Q0_9FIRM|nr:pitrilysin family protein [Alkaliphilus flagellatus]MBU5677469.1 insulinase family protein [Alkaliphilus flagellatus]
MYKRYTLENGLRVVTEYIPFVKSVSIGVWIEAGSKHENTINNGISHFIEHMVFKGTDKRTAKDIADIIDSVGGQINAFTSKECTCYYTKVLDSHYDLAIDLLSDMLFNSKFDPIEIEKERSVILEEINMYEDSPEDLVHDILSQTLFKNNSLGMPILGTEDTLHNIDREMILQYMDEYYVSNNAVLSIAGNFDEKKLLETINDKFSTWSNNNNLNKAYETINYNFEVVSKYKEIEQTHLCIGFKGAELDSNDVYPLLILNNVLGGSMSSKLFQSVREERGLAYSIYSYPSIYKNGGSLVIYAGTNPNQVEEVTKIIYNEIKDIISNSLSEDEINKSKEQLKGNYILGLESTSSRMTSIGKSELLRNRIYSQKEIIDKIDSVNSADIQRVIQRIFKLDEVTITTVSKDNIIKTIKNIFEL